MAPAQAVIIWDWSVGATGSNGPITGTGTFTTDGTTPTPLTTYAITSVTGSFTANNSNTGTSGTLPVTGLYSPSNFQWSGSSTNQLLVQSLFPNMVRLESSDYNIIMEAPDFSDFIPLQRIRVTDGGYCDSCDFGAFYFHSLVPQGGPPASVPSVPGPLPLFGAAAAFGASRRLRQRIKLHNSSQHG